MNIQKAVVIVLCLVGVHYVYKSFVTDRATFALHNLSDVAVKEVTVEVGGDEQIFYNIAPGATEEGNFRVAKEGQFAVAARFTDGTRVQGDVGYIMPGRASRDTITLKRDGVFLELPAP